MYIDGAQRGDGSAGNCCLTCQNRRVTPYERGSVHANTSGGRCGTMSQRIRFDLRSVKLIHIFMQMQLIRHERQGGTTLSLVKIGTGENEGGDDVVVCHTHCSPGHRGLLV